MGMLKWRYIGTVTATIDHPRTGPTVLTPQMDFEAPLVVVAHLKSIGRVVEFKDKPERVGPNRRPPRPLPKSRKGPKPKHPPEVDAEPVVPVVVSGLSNSATEKGTESRRLEKGKGKEKESKPVKKSQKESRSK